MCAAKASSAGREKPGRRSIDGSAQAAGGAQGGRAQTARGRPTSQSSCLPSSSSKIVSTVCRQSKRRQRPRHGIGSAN
eukprot:2077853-Pleurochrysis_carterae.AAC.1